MQISYTNLTILNIQLTWNAYLCKINYKLKRHLKS